MSNKPLQNSLPQDPSDFARLELPKLKVSDGVALQTVFGIYLPLASSQ